MARHGMTMASYHDTRLAFDPRRETLWKSLWRFYFSRLIRPDDCVLELGAGYGHFINNVVARRRIAVDAWPEFVRYLAPGVQGIVGDASDIESIEDGAVDFAFASNLFEHLSHAEIARALAVLARKIRSGGTLAILQPNYRYCSREYFDDFTHVSVFSHVSLADFLRAHDYDVFEIRPRFLPLSVKSRLPVSPGLIWLYLHSPVKPLGKQMLIRARPRKPR
jgi:SAM-dependent methyltransferase